MGREGRVRGFWGAGSSLFLNLNGDHPGVGFMCICFRHFSVDRLSFPIKGKHW